MVDGWTEKEIEIVRDLARSGYTSQQIAVRLPKPRSKNSVIGICFRKGIQLMGRVNRQDNAKKLKPHYFSPHQVMEKKQQIVKPLPSQTTIKKEIVEFGPENKNIMQLGHFDCRAILGDVNGIDTIYCGKKAKEHKSWCEHHFSLYTEITSRGRYAAE